MGRGSNLAWGHPAGKKKTKGARGPKALRTLKQFTALGVGDYSSINFFVSSAKGRISDGL